MNKFTTFYAAAPKWLQEIIHVALALLIAMVLLIAPKESPEDAQATADFKQETLQQAKHDAAVNMKARQVAEQMLSEEHRNGN